MKVLALLGVTAGLISISQGRVEATDANSINLDHVIAKPACKSIGGGCGKIALRDRNNILGDNGNNSSPNNSNSPTNNNNNGWSGAGGNDVDTAPFSSSGGAGIDSNTSPFSGDGGGGDFDTAPFDNGGGGDFDSAPYGD